MPALQIIALDTTTPRLRAPGSGDTYSAPRAVDIAPESLTGSAATSSLSIAQTWNTTGTPTAIDLNVTDTASNASSLLMNLRVGGSSQLSVSKTGRINKFWSGSAPNLLFSFSSFSGEALGNSGIGSDGSGVALYVGNGTAPGVKLGGSGVFVIDVFGAVSFGSVGVNSPDVFLRRDAANTLAQRNGTNAQAFNIYNTFTDASNYERGFVRWSSNVLSIGTEAAGTGSNRSVQFLTAGLARWRMLSTGDFCAGTDDTYSIGSNASDRPRNINMTGYTQMQEDTAPAAPAANNVRIYAEDDGAGKTRLMALFATGAAQQIAIEP